MIIAIFCTLDRVLTLLIESEYITKHWFVTKVKHLFRWSLLCKFFLLLFKYSFLPFLPSSPHHPRTPQLPPLFPPHLIIVHVSFITVPANPSPFSPINPLPSPLWSLSACSQFQCLWLYFTCLFVLLIRFQLKVRSYGICVILFLRYLKLSKCF